jgi:uncharacterized protein YidB (DUF937 family)
MGWLDQVIGGVLGSRRGGMGGSPMGGRGGMSPLMMALLALLASRSMGQGGSGGLGGILGGLFGGGQPGGGHSGGGLSDSALGGMLGGGHSAGAPGGVNPTGIDTSVLYPGGSPVGGGLVDPSAGPFAGTTPTDEMGGGLGGGLGGMLGGGLGSLIERFNQGGYGDVIGSWIGTGENRRIAPDELQNALGGDTVEALSRETGMGRDELLSELSDTLPEVVDRLTPDGRLPDEDEMGRWV